MVLGICGGLGFRAVVAPFGTKITIHYLSITLRTVPNIIPGCLNTKLSFGGGGLSICDKSQDQYIT